MKLCSENISTRTFSFHGPLYLGLEQLELSTHHLPRHPRLLAEISAHLNQKLTNKTEHKLPECMTKNEHLFGIRSCNLLRDVIIALIIIENIQFQIHLGLREKIRTSGFLSSGSTMNSFSSNLQAVIMNVKVSEHYKGHS